MMLSFFTSIIFLLSVSYVASWSSLDRVTLDQPVNIPFAQNATERPTVPACVYVTGFIDACEPYNFVGDRGCRQGSYEDLIGDLEGEYIYSTTAYNGFPVYVKPVFLRFARVVKTYVLSVVNEKGVLAEPSVRKGGAWAAFTPNSANFRLAFQGAEVAFAFTSTITPPGSCGQPSDFPLCLSGQKNIFWLGIAGECNGVRLDNYCSFGQLTLDIVPVECGATPPPSTTLTPTPDPLYGVARPFTVRIRNDTETTTPRFDIVDVTQTVSVPDPQTTDAPDPLISFPLTIPLTTTPQATTSATPSSGRTRTTTRAPRTGSTTTDRFTRRSTTPPFTTTRARTVPADATRARTTSSTTRRPVTTRPPTIRTPRTTTQRPTTIQRSTTPRRTTTTTTRAPTQTPVRRFPIFGFLPLLEASSAEEEQDEEGSL